MPLYNAKIGDSPAIIAKRFGVSREALVAANPHKPTTRVAGQRTWQSLRANEKLIVPAAGVGMLGAIAPADPMAPHAMIRRGSSGADVALWQTIIGTTPDGSFGPNTDAATRAWQSAHGVAADGIVGPKTWAAAVGGLATPSVPSTTSTPTVSPAPSSPSLVATASAAVAALNADSNYCVSVGHGGTAVNTAVHNFKAAWNAANPGHAVPIGTGKYEPSVAAALWSALGGQVTVPPGCGVGAAAPAPAPTPAQPGSAPSMPAPAPVPRSNVPTAVLALLSINPCDQANASFVSQAQSALGVSADGKYGTDTANAARRVLPGAPAGCSPRPAWWTPPGQTNNPAHPPGAPAPAPTQPAPGLPPPPPPVVVPGGPGSFPPPGPPPPPPPAPPAPGSTVPVPSPGGAITPPDAKKGISTGAIVVGALGAVGLVGLIAMAAMSKKPGHRGPAGKRGKRGPAKHKKSKKR